MRVIAGHLGWVRAVAVDPANKWFATGAGDRTIKIWDLASGTLKLTLTGHISTVRGLAVSARSPYLFSCAEDKTVKCWDLEQNKVVRHYHGHLSGVYCAALHPTLDCLVTGGRDSTARVWDIRTKHQVHVLAGHTNTVVALGTQDADPQVVTGSMDNTIRYWDLVRCCLRFDFLMTAPSCPSTCPSIDLSIHRLVIPSTLAYRSRPANSSGISQVKGERTVSLTNHKKSVRALAMHPTEYGMASASADNIKVNARTATCPQFAATRSHAAGLIFPSTFSSSLVLFALGRLVLLALLHFYLLVLLVPLSLLTVWDFLDLLEVGLCSVLRVGRLCYCAEMEVPARRVPHELLRPQCDHQCDVCEPG